MSAIFIFSKEISIQLATKHTTQVQHKIIKTIPNEYFTPSLFTHTPKKVILWA